MAAGTPGQARGPADRTVVYLVRHGQTPLNESGILRGLLDPPLDEAGRQQAQRLAAALGPQTPHAVIASPLLRATQTAQPIADRVGLDVTADERLLDRDYGQWTGAERDTVVARWGSVDNAPGVEPQAAVRDRAVDGLTDIGRRSHGGTAVAVSHDAVTRQLLVAFDPGLGDPDTLPQDNGCFNTLELRAGTWTVLSVGELPAQP
jgi:glucosyl-3-phosphoglycerate phosphatase